MRCSMMRQFSDSPDWVLNDNFTITQDYLTGGVLFIRTLFQMMMLKMNQSQRPGNSAQNPSAPAAAPIQNNNTPQLNASNLQQLQDQQEEALELARRVPHAYGPNGLQPEKLKLPPPKKRKQSQGGPISASPVQPEASPNMVNKTKQAPGPGKNHAVASDLFKCSVVECQHHSHGFPTEAALLQHVEEAHQAEEEEEIGDILEWYSKSVAIGLGLNADDQQNKVNNGVSATNPPNNRQHAMASPAKNGILTPVTASNTPMARATSQLGIKPATPQLLTPQQGNKAKPSPNSDAKKPGKRTLDEMEGKEKEDPWKDCPISMETFHDTFSPLLSLGTDPCDEFLNDAMFNQDQSDDTPDSLDNGILTPSHEYWNAPDDDSQPVGNWWEWEPEMTNVPNPNLPNELDAIRFELREGGKYHNMVKDLPEIPTDPETLKKLVDWENIPESETTTLENGGIAIATV
ncbi:hypothetical protein N7470_008664 [Penicillium chermesinum]|nr:hypothetical protein N7470_008664 [Penicillium chermesinum]